MHPRISVSAICTFPWSLDEDLDFWTTGGISNVGVSVAKLERLVQVSDFSVGTLSTPNRLVPGDGDVALERIIGEVLDAGYGGCFDLELIGPRIDEEGYPSAIRRSIDWLTDVLTRLGA